MHVLRQMGVSARAPASGQPGGRPQVALMVLEAIYGIHYFRARDPKYRSLRSALSMHPAGCHILSRSMAGETINKPNGPAGSIGTVATAIGRKRSLGCLRLSV
jgi:hypothetical protein